MKILKAKLLELERQKQKEEKAYRDRMGTIEALLR